MPEAVPASIVAGLEQLGEKLADWVQTHRDAPLVTHEEGVLAAMREALPALLEAVVEESTTALAPEQQRLRAACPDCGTRTPARRQWRRRTVTTRCGTLQYERPCYWCRGCQRGWCPADTTLAVAPRARVSAGLDAWLGDLGALAPFRTAAGLLHRLTGIAVSSETLRQYAERQGAALEAAQQAATARVLATRAAAEPVEAAPGLLVVQADGVMVRYRQTGWHEVKVGLVAGWEGGRLVAPSYVAAREAADAFGPRLLAEAARRGALEIVGWRGPRTGPGLAVLRRVVVLGDGAVWIWQLAAEHFGECLEIVDFYHASEHIWALAHALYGGATPLAAAAAEGWLRLLREQGAAGLLDTLRRVRATTPEGQEALRRERGYFRTNTARMAYPAFVAQGLPIGSGAVEAAANHVVQLRLKRPGARWSVAGAQAILTLRAHVLSRPLRLTRSGERRRQRARRQRLAPTAVAC
jgi:hypothetical protein